MKAIHSIVPLVAGLLAGVPFLSLNADEPTGAWNEAVVVGWDQERQEEFETTIKVWDLQPELNRNFYWEGDVDEAGFATGKGKLRWREEGAPDYGPEGLLSVYTGFLDAGKRTGKGKIRFANGEKYEGAWENDLPHGWGEFWYANGDYYQGYFSAGKMEGKGMYARHGMEVYEGTFKGGKRNGEGTVEWPGGVRYESEWVNGLETPESLTRRKTALERIAASEEAIQFGLVSSLAKNEYFRRATLDSVTYESYYEEGEFGFRPVADMLESYREGGLVRSEMPAIGSLFMEMAFENQETRQVVIERGEVEVIESIPDLSPYIVPRLGASEIQFDLANAGWGGARNCVFDFNLHRYGEGPEPGTDETYEFQIQLGDFKERLLKVDMTKAFEECGVDVAFAREHEYDSMNFRGKWTRDQGDAVYGRFAKYDDKGFLDSASVGLHARLSYEWTDAEGETHSHSVLYEGFIQLIYLVEGGDAMGGNAKYDVALQYEGENYRLPFPFSQRVEPFQDARFGLDLNVERSSHHRFRVLLHCSDGTMLRSPVCRVHLFRPRDLDFELHGIDGGGGEIIMPGDSPYLFPDSHERLLGDDELSQLTRDDLWRARNEIFARRGYIFGSDRGKELAESLGDLYQPVGGIDEIEPLLNAAERANIEAIRRYESR